MFLENSSSPNRSVASTSNPLNPLNSFDSDSSFSCTYDETSLARPPNTNWRWNGARLVRELGRGFYGTVYLAEEVSGRLVAVKSVDRANKGRKRSNKVTEGVFQVLMLFQY